MVKPAVGRSHFVWRILQKDIAFLAVEYVPGDLGQVLSPPPNAQLSIATAGLGESRGENCRRFQWELLLLETSGPM